jgi:hypothetical protein
MLAAWDIARDRGRLQGREYVSLFRHARGRSSASGMIVSTQS